MRLMRHVVVAVLAAAVLAVFGVGAAYGAKPVREPAQLTGFSFPAGLVCPFAVEAEVVTDRVTETMFSSGKVALRGFFAGRLIGNGNEITVAAPGPITITPRSDGLIDFKSTGPSIIFFFPGDAGPGDTSTGRTYLLKGHTEILVDPTTFAFLDFTFSGRAVDLCAALA
jgi:hypothetical protein